MPTRGLVGIFRVTELLALNQLRSTVIGIPESEETGLASTKFGVGSGTMSPSVLGPLIEVHKAFSGCFNMSSTAVAS